MRAIGEKNKIKAPAACLILLSIALNLTLISSLLRLPEPSASTGAKSLIRVYSAALAYREEDARGYRLLVGRDRLRITGGLPGLSFAGIPPESTSAAPLCVCGFVMPGEGREDLGSVKIVSALHLKDGMK